MKEITHECYVSLELAKLLKEAGFDWDCHGIRVLDSENDPDSVFSTATFKYRGTEVEGYIKLPAPTIDVAQRWLREVKEVDILVHIDYHYGEDYSKAYYCTFYIEDELYTAEHFKTYEEALEAGIKKALEMILEKGTAH